MTLGAPVWLNLLWVLPLLAGLLLRAQRRRRQDREALVAAGLLARQLPPGLDARRRWQATLTLLGLALTALAAAQPRWGFSWRETEQRGVEVIVALDLSRSMDAADVAPSRLDRARREVLDLLSELGGDRVGLVVFAGGAYAQVPLTLDHAALAGILADSDTAVLQAQGSALSGALDVCLDLFGEQRGVDRAVVLISDGELHGEDPTRAAAALAEAGVRVYAIGVGTEAGAPIPEAGGGFKQGPSGEVVITRLEEQPLQRVAEATGGAYVRSVAGAADVRSLVSEMRSVMERMSSERRRERVWDERFQVPLAAGLGLLVLGLALGDRGRALTLALALGVGTARAATPDDPLTLARTGDPVAAVDALARAQVEDPDDPRVQWALAEALLRAGRPDEAAEAFEALHARAPDEGTRRDALYNLGYARARAGRLDEAVAAWDALLAEDPAYEAAARAAEAVRQEIAARRTPPQDPPPQAPPPEAPPPQDGEGEPDPQPSPQSAPPAEDGAEAPQPAPDGQDPGEASGAEEPPPSGPLSEIQEPGGEPGPEALAEPAEGVAPMSPDEARRLLEGVEEGRPRVVAGGRSREMDW